MADNSYPLDLDGLSKGQLLTPEFLQDVTGVRISDLPRFRFAVLGIQKLIQDTRGFTVKANEDGLTILTDGEAAEHNAKWFDHHVRGLYNRYELATEVDIANLTPDQRIRHDQSLIRNSRILQSVTREIKSIRIEATKQRDDNRFLNGSNGKDPEIL